MNSLLTDAEFHCLHWQTNMSSLTEL